MRSVSIHLLDADLTAVEGTLTAAGFERISAERNRWNYPAGPDPVLYLSCKPYTIDVEFPEEHADIIRFTEGKTPTVWVHCDVSGRAAGDMEVRHLVEALLSSYRGVTFDDYTSLAHGWTLEEIRRGEKVDGIGFFDGHGYIERGKARRTDD
jgi:hypothetical protein